MPDQNPPRPDAFVEHFVEMAGESPDGISKDDFREWFALNCDNVTANSPTFDLLWRQIRDLALRHFSSEITVIGGSRNRRYIHPRHFTEHHEQMSVRIPTEHVVASLCYFLLKPENQRIGELQGWSKSELIDGTGYTPPVKFLFESNWASTIRMAKELGAVIQHGMRKGAKYTPGPNVSEYAMDSREIRNRRAHQITATTQISVRLPTKTLDYLDNAPFIEGSSRSEKIRFLIEEAIRDS